VHVLLYCAWCGGCHNQTLKVDLELNPHQEGAMQLQCAWWVGFTVKSEPSHHLKRGINRGWRKSNQPPVPRH
jgi:hypothetical protein